MFWRASSFAPGATESSRSMNTSSAGRLGALASIFGDDPGTDRQDRRGRMGRGSSDMSTDSGIGRLIPSLEGAFQHRSRPNGALIFRRDLSVLLACVSSARSDEHEALAELKTTGGRSGC